MDGRLAGWLVAGWLGLGAALAPADSKRCEESRLPQLAVAAQTLWLRQEAHGVRKRSFLDHQTAQVTRSFQLLQTSVMQKNAGRVKIKYQPKHEKQEFKT